MKKLFQIFWLSALLLIGSCGTDVTPTFNIPEEDHTASTPMLRVVEEFDAIVVFRYGQSNQAGFVVDDSLQTPYLTLDSNIVFWNGSSFLPMDKDHNEYPAENDKFAAEFSFAWKLRAATGKKIYIVKHAVGSTSMNANWKVGASLFNNSKTTLTNALAAISDSYILVGMMNQGEGDCGNTTLSNAYQNLYSAHLSNLRTAFSFNYYICTLTDPNLPFPTNYAAKIRASQINVINATADTSITYVDTQMFRVLFDSTSTGTGSTTLTDANQSWTTNQWTNCALNIIVSGQITTSPIRKKIGSNTGTVITLNTAWSPTPASVSDYQIAYTNLHFSATQIDSLGAMEFRTLYRMIYP